MRVVEAAEVAEVVGPAGVQDPKGNGQPQVKTASSAIPK